MEHSEILRRIQAFFYETKRMPTVREVRDGILRAKSMKRTKAALDSLVEAGSLLRDKTGKLLPSKFFPELRKLGTIEAGFPSPAEEELLDTMTLDEWLINNREATYMLEVKGRSMINAGIHPGDVVLVERGKQVKENDIVIACVDGKWTMKYYRMDGENPTLVPANPKFKTIRPVNELRVEAVVIAVIRKY